MTPDPLAIYQQLLPLIGLPPDQVDVTIKGRDPVLPSTHRIGDACAAALALAGTAISLVSHARGGPLDAVCVEVEDAVMQLSAAFYTKVNNVGLLRFFEDPKLFTNSDFYPTRDGRHVFLLISYPHLRDAACQVLQCPPEREAYARCIAAWDAFPLEDALDAAGGCGVALRTREEWQAHPQGQALEKTPLISVDKIQDTAAPIPLSPLERNALPLSGIRVLDNGHVIAAPIVSRLAAEFGANVLHISSPDHADSPAMLNETGLGKLNAFCDLNEAEEREKLDKILSTADVYVCNYRSLERKGYSAVELASKRPGLIFVDVTGWGREGPWTTRGGFDQLACTATGFSAEEGSWTAPALPPTYLLNDYLAAILGFSGALSALLRRAKEGGSYVVRLNLASVVMWVQSLGTFTKDKVETLAPIDHQSPQAKARLSTVQGPNGKATYLPFCASFSSIKPRFPRGAEPAGASELSWEAFKK